jgi:uncharacterized repeat protein (TIGR01451 family)
MKCSPTSFFKSLFVVFLLAQACLGFAQNASTYNGYLAQRYYQLELQLIKTSTGIGWSPPVVSRALGYTGLALYESVVPGMPTYQSADGILNGLGPNAITDPGAGPYHWPTSANNALGTLIDSLYGNVTAINKALIRDLKDSFNTAFLSQIPTATYNNSVAFGSAIAADVYAYSATDGGHKGYATNFPTSYVIPTGPGFWEKTPPAYSLALQPYWGNNRPFLLENTTGDAFIGANPPFSAEVGSPFYNDALLVYTTKQNLTPQQTTITQYWADGGNTVTPPGHSLSILTELSKNENQDLAAATLAFSKLSLSQMDAFINCWKTKYTYNLMRPITYIRTYIDSTWTSLIPTPPFPEYTSGHSTQSGAMESVMTGIFGANYGFVDHTHGTSFGGARSFANFGQAADEAAVSRLYGGIHYEFSNTLGVEYGHKIGNNINKLFATELQINPTADVSLQASFSVSKAAIGDTVTLTISVFNAGLTEINGLQIQNYVPAQTNFLSAMTDFGTYTAATGIWNVGTIPAGMAQVDLVFKLKINADGVPYHLAEVIAMTESDLDSAPNNQLNTEDDMASACMSVPVILCNPDLTLAAPAGFTTYQWYSSQDGGVTYTPGATTQSIVVTEPGLYIFTTDDGILGTCGSQLCCPIIVEKFCCPVNICLPVTLVRVK